MRTLLQLGLFVLSLGFVTTADAQGRRRAPDPRQTTVVIDTRRAPTPPPDWRRARHHRARSAAHIDLQRQRRDHEEIVRISRRWRQASYHQNPDAKRNVKRRANAWIDREIAESQARPNSGRYVIRLSALQRELNARHRRYGYRYDYGYGHGRGYAAERKARVLDELVALSATELRRAEMRARRHMHVAYSVR